MSRTHGFGVGLAVLIGLLLAVAPAYAKRDKTAKNLPPSEPKVTLPEAAEKAVKDAFPNATTGTVKLENEGGMVLYRVALWEGAAEKTVDVSSDGAIAEVGTPVAISDVPEAAAKSLRGADDSAIVVKVVKAEVRAEVKQEGGAPKLVKCEKPKTAYEGILAKGDQAGRIKVAEDGSVLSPLAWQSKPAEPSAKAGRGGRGGRGGGGKKRK